MEIKAYIRTIMRYWFVVALVTFVSGATAAFLVSVKRPVYSANARVATRPATVLSDTRTIVDLLGQMTARSVTGTFAQAFTSSDVKAAARQAVGLSEKDAGNYPLEANILPDSLVLEVSGTGPDPGMLVNYINATVDATVQLAPTLFRVVDLVPLDPAHFPQAPTSPQPSRDIPLGIALGLLLGIMLALTIDYFRTPRAANNLRALPPTPTQRERRDA
ncbi:MAG TPA: hypothetical protein VJ183_16920 [Chloroflexia bacterium]|nr:hypothetical protein [Chloroflexia bacterium]